MRAVLGISLLWLLLACGSSPSAPVSEGDDVLEKEMPQVLGDGRLFIIGGGSRPDSLIASLLETADAMAGDTVFIIPWASSEPDTASYYAEIGFKAVQDVHCHLLDTMSQWSSALAHAKTIYITGGDQNRLMDVLLHDGRLEALRSACAQGATVAGTSAGAAVMSAIMISGDQLLEPDYERTYSRLMHENAVYARGAALVRGAIVDQHFVERSRYNRLITAVADHRGYWGIGVGESTAAILSAEGLEVSGSGQVILMHPWAADERERLISGRGLEIDVLTAGMKYDWNE